LGYKPKIPVKKQAVCVILMGLAIYTRKYLKAKEEEEEL
jgi:hypothetical protein